MKRGTAHVLIIPLLVLATVYGGLVTPSSGVPSRSVIQQATPVPSQALQYEAVAPAFRREVMAATDQRLSHYTVTATLHPPGSSLPGTPHAGSDATPLATPFAATMATPVAPDASPAASPEAAPVVVEAPLLELATITGTQEIHFVNDTGAPLQELYLRLYPNLRQYGDGRMVVQDLTVDGIPIMPDPPPLFSVPGATPAVTSDVGSGDLVLLRLPLHSTIPPTGTTTVRMAFTTTVPMASPDGSGLFAFTEDTGTWVLAHWFPILAGYDPVSGWDLEPPAAWSDPVFSNTALFDVTLTAPPELVLVTTGVQVDESTQGPQQVRRFVSGPVREFTVVADNDFASVSTTVGETTVTSSYNPQDAEGGAQMLAWAAQSLAVFSELFGPYPYATLDVVAIPNVTGFEFPQLIFIGTDFYPDPEGSGSRPGAIEFLVAHEVSHQWWYGLVGNNQHRHAFLDESLAEYSGVLYFERQHGRESAEAQLDAGLRLRYATMLLTASDQVVDQPSTAFPDTDAYYATVYRKGGLGVAALRDEIGDAAFFAGLQSYVETRRFGVAAPEDLQLAFERAAGRDLDAFWQLWFETASGRVEIIMQPAAPGPATPDVASPIATPVVIPEQATPIASPVEAIPGVEPTVSSTPVSATPETANPESVTQSGPVDDRASLVNALRTAGLSVETVDTVEQPFLQTNSGTVVRVSGEEVTQPAELQVFEYQDAEGAAIDAAQIGPDGQPPTMMINWLATPHFYQAERLIVLYVGDDPMVVDLLTALLGPPFAGG